MTVWAEGVFLLNAGLDLGLLAGAARLLGRPLRRRLLLAAVLGGALALLALLPVPALSGLPGRTLGLVLLTACAYGVSLDALRQGVLFLGLSLALCGVQAALAELFAWGAVLFRGGVLLPVSWRSLAVSAALLYGACAALSGAVRERKRLLLRTQATRAAGGCRGGGAAAGPRAGGAPPSGGDAARPGTGAAGAAAPAHPLLHRWDGARAAAWRPVPGAAGGPGAAQRRDFGLCARRGVGGWKLSRTDRRII